MTTAAALRRLVRGAFSEDGTVPDDLARLLLQLSSRVQLKAFLAAMRREQVRRSVSIRIDGEQGPARAAVAERYPGRPLDVSDDSSLGAGLRVRAGDDIVDASVSGIIRKIIAELGTNASATQENAPGAQK